MCYPRLIHLLNHPIVCFAFIGYTSRVVFKRRISGHTHTYTDRDETIFKVNNKPVWFDSLQQANRTLLYFVQQVTLSDHTLSHHYNILQPLRTIIHLHYYTYICIVQVHRVTWGMTAPGGKTVPPPVDNLKLPRTFTEYTECCYHLPDTCFERSTPRSRRTLKYSIFNIYTFFDVIFAHHYTCHSSLYISDNKESIISCQHMITILITTMVSIERHYVLFPKNAFF